MQHAPRGNKALPATRPEGARHGRVTWSSFSGYRIGGYASVFGNVDAYGEVVDKGAFVKSIEASGGDVPVYYGHNLWDGMFTAGKPIGHTVALHETEHGLYYEAELAHTREALDVLNLIANGAIKGSSFSFDVLGEYEDDFGVRHLTELKLIEISPVVYPANPMATVQLLPIAEPAFKSAWQQLLGEIERVGTALA